jgi:hypothetical protein
MDLDPKAQNLKPFTRNFTPEVRCPEACTRTRWRVRGSLYGQELTRRGLVDAQRRGRVRAGAGVRVQAGVEAWPVSL